MKSISYLLIRSNTVIVFINYFTKKLKDGLIYDLQFKLVE
jgi:hypothetical protein